jgi:hypothetical protein
MSSYGEPQLLTLNKPIMNRSWMIFVVLLTGFCATNQAGISPKRERWLQKEFLITFWCPPPATDDALTRVAAEGFNLTWTPADGLDVAARHGLRAMLQSELLVPETLRDEAKRKQLDELIERVKNHPAMEAYYLTDEPGAAAFPGLGQLVAYLRQHDPTHLAYINLFPTYANEQQLGVSADAADRARVSYPTNFAGVETNDKTVLRYREHLKQFAEIVKPDLISYDHYHFLKPDKEGKPVDGKQYFLNLGLIRLAALETKVPFLNIIQADTIEKSWRLPNAQEMRFLVFTTLAYGGRGISYFTYWGPAAYNGLYIDGKPAPLLDAVVSLNQELKTFGPELMKLDSISVHHTAPLEYGAEAIPAEAPIQVMGTGKFVLGLFGKGGKPTAFMIVNRDYEQRGEAILSIGLRGQFLEEFDRGSGHWSRGETFAKNRTVKLVLEPGDGRLFRIAEGLRLKSPRDAAD